MSSLGRRKFSASLLAGAAALVLPESLRANHRRAVDLVITRLRWSEDQGITWHQGQVAEGSDVLFEALVRNQGQAAAAVGRQIRVDFRINGVVVARATSTSGLSPGVSRALVANGGPDGDRFWNEPGVGTYTLQGRVDPANVFQSEHSGTINGETNNTRSAQIVVEGVAEPPPGDLTPSGPVTATATGQVIEGLDITATGTANGVRVNGFSNVTVRGCRIRHATGKGVYGSNAPGLRVEDCDILCTAAPAAGQNPNSGMNNIHLENCDDAVVRRVRVEKGSSGLWAKQSDRIHVSFIAGKDFRGPFPRGQVVQFDQCVNAVLEDFSCENDGRIAWTEDNVNCYGCTNPVIRRGFIRGNNSASGIGVLFENGVGGSGGLCEDVDVVYWGNGAFSAADNSNGVRFVRCRARDGIDVSPNDSDGDPDYQGQAVPGWAAFVGTLGRNDPLSGSEAFHAYQTGAANIEYHDCVYFNLPHNSNVAWDQSRMSVREFTQVDFTPRTPVVITMPWEA